MSRSGVSVDMLGSGAVSRQASGRLVVATRGPGFTEITAEVAEVIGGADIRHGLAVLFCRHTSASLVIQENADPDVREDLATALDGLAPRDAGYVHGAEGPDDMPAHIRTMLTGSTLAIPVISGRLALGTWQGVYLVEHRDAPHRREVVVTVVGD